MAFNCKYRFEFFCWILFAFSTAISGFAGVSRTIQEQYKGDYENKAIFLKIPVYSERQLIHISGQDYRIERGSGVPRYKVGDQLRVVLIDFASDEIKLKMIGITSPGAVEFSFKFDISLQEDFPNRNIFNQALQSVLMGGLKYSEIEEAKRTYIEDQFERSVQDLAGSASVSRESALKSIAPLVPSYQEARREIDTLKSRVQDISGQLADAQSENRKLEADLKTQQAELARLKNSNSALQERIANSTSQISKLGDDLRDAKGTAQGYQKELVNIQRSLNLKVDAGRDLSLQIADLGQVLRKLQKDNEVLGQQFNALRANLEAQLAANARLVGDNEELKTGNRKLQSTIETLSSKEDSLARQYLNLKTEKEKLDDFSQSINLLQTRITEEKTEDGIRLGKAQVYLKNILLGSLEWSIPASLRRGQSLRAEAAFSAESIDYVRATPEEKHILRTLGDPLKVRIDLVPNSDSIQIASDKPSVIHEIKERDRSSWEWTLSNQGTQDSRILFEAHLVNLNAREISMFQQEHPLVASNAVRQIRSYLQPIPLVAGIILGFLLFGIVGIFRRHKVKRPTPPSSQSNSVPPSEHIGKKQL
jgi:predicted nuclease with TOPRIM domain